MENLHQDLYDFQTFKDSSHFENKHCPLYLKMKRIQEMYVSL